MGERDDARRSIEDARERMSVIAEELSRRASPEYVSGRAREVAVRKTTEWKDKGASSPLFLGIVGGTLGALAGRAIAKRNQDKWDEENWAGERYGYSGSTYREPSVYNDRYGREPGSFSYEGRYSGGFERSYERDYRYPDASPEVQSDFDENASSSADDGGAIKAKAEGVKESVKSKAQEIGHKASSTFSNVKDKATDKVSHARARAGERYDSMPSRGEMISKVRDNPSALLFGGLAIGALVALFTPVSDRERRVMEPAKERVREQARHVQEKVESKLQGNQQQEEPSVSSSSGGLAGSGASTYEASPVYGDEPGGLH